MKNFSKFTVKLKKQSSVDLQSKRCSQKFHKFHKKDLCLTVIFNQIESWKTEAIEKSN